MNVALRSSVRLTGRVTVQLHDLDGRLLQEVSNHNLVVKSGRNVMRDLVSGFTAFPTHLGAGTNDTDADDEDVALGEEVIRIVVISRTPGVSAVTIRAFMGSTVGNGFDYVEAALFTGSATDQNAVMFSRATHDSITKTASNTITYIWHLDLTSL